MIRTLFCFFALLAPAFAAPWLALPPADAPLTQTFAIGIDSRMRKGQSDINGDYKSLISLLRKGNWVLAFSGSLETGQGVRTAQLRDMAQGKITLGQETRTLSLYATLGTTRLGVPEAAFAFVDSLHKISGMGGKARRSRLVNASAVIAGIDARYDVGFTKETCEGFCPSLHLAGFTTLNTLETSVGAGAYLAFTLKKQQGKVSFKPHLQGLPVQEIKETSLYLGARGKLMGHDALYTGLAITPLRFELNAGLTLKTQSFGLGGDYALSLTPEIKGVSARPVHKIMLRTSFTF